MMQKPPHYQEIYNEGRMYLNSGRYIDALKTFQRANNVWENSYGYSGIGRALYGLEKYKDALNNFQTAYKMYPSNLQAAHWIAKSLGKLKRYKESETQFITVLRLLKNGKYNFYREVYDDYIEMMDERDGKIHKKSPLDSSLSYHVNNNSTPNIIINGDIKAPINLGGIQATDDAIINRAEIDNSEKIEKHTIISKLFTMKKLTCPNCGAKINEEQIFCNMCGAKLK